MFAVTTSDRFSLPSPTVLAVFGAIILAQLGLLAVYLHALEIPLRTFHLYPIVWITVGIGILWRVRPAVEDPRRRLLAAGVAGAYFLLLAVVSGLVGLGYGLFEQTALTGADPAAVDGARMVVAEVPPGHGPALLYVGPHLTLALIPYLLVGYLALAYLVYVTFMDAAAAAAPGVLGLFGCIGCSWPIIAFLITGAGGTVTSIAGAVYAYAYPISTLAFLLAVGLLYWRPGFGDG